MIILELTPKQAESLLSGVVNGDVIKIVNEAFNSAGSCAVCEEPFTPKKTKGSQVRLYCGTNCKQKAQRARANERKKRSR